MQLIDEVISITQQYHEDSKFKYLKLSTLKDIKHFIINYIGLNSQENIIILALNSSDYVNAIYRLAIGTVNYSNTDVREIFKAALLNNASSIIIGHNHPNSREGLMPSSEDIKFTEKVVMAGNILGIPLVDHIIVNENSSFSFRDFDLF